MSKLVNKRCVPCAGGVPPMSLDQAQQLLVELGGGWELVGGVRLKKTYQFDSFSAAIDWVNQLARLAEEEGHHPNISVEFRKVSLEIWTHKIDGLSESDFILAAKADRLV